MKLGITGSPPSTLVAYCTDTAGNRWRRDVRNFRTPIMRAREREFWLVLLAAMRRSTPEMR